MHTLFHCGKKKIQHKIYHLKVQDELYFYIGLYIDSEPASSLDNAFIRVKAFLFDHDTALES